MSRADKYRGATVEDLDPPSALSIGPQTSIHEALFAASSHDYTHLTVIHPQTRALLGYLSMPRLQSLLLSGSVSDSDPVDKVMLKFVRKARAYQVITMETPLEELESFFDQGQRHDSLRENRPWAPPAEKGGGAAAEGVVQEKQDFAIVTDAERKFVLGVATRGDLDEFVKRRPGPTTCGNG